MSDLAEMDRFLRRYEALKGRFEDQRAREFEAAFGVIRQRFKEAEEASRKLALDYNIFRILNITHLENETHTAMLANLLDPRGSHGQGALFLKAFFHVLANKKEEESGHPFPVPEGDFSNSKWFVTTQHFTQSGILDIVALCPTLKYLLVIENKVEALEQADQIQRYSEWTKRFVRQSPNQALVFLTPNGRKAETAHGSPYYRASYESDVTMMLEELLNDSLPARLRESVKQYLEVVKLIGEEAGDGEPEGQEPDR